MADMATFLDSAEPDYADEVLSIKPHEVLHIEDSENQIIDRFDDNSDETYAYSDTVEWRVFLKWENLSSANHDTIFGLYYDPVKANKKARSFLWEHPTDGNTYVVKFTSKLERQETPVGRYNIKATLRVLGV